MKDYHTTHMVLYKPETEIFGHLSVEVLPCLKGKKWDEVALAYVHTLRPTSIRVTTGEVKADARDWRVTVIVDEQDIIQEVTQEVEVWLPEKVAHGAALDAALEYGIDSEQCQFYNDDEIEGYVHGFGGTFSKYRSDGNVIFYPGMSPEDIKGDEDEK